MAAHGVESWVSDGTAAGTLLLGDLLPGPGSGVGCDYGPGHDGVYVAAENGTSTGLDVWKTDGTPGGTRRVASLPNVGSDTYWVEEYTSAGSATLFEYCQEDFMSFGCVLWATDGTPAGTQEFVPAGPARSASDPRELTARNGGILFAADDEETSSVSYVSDGTEAGTQPLAGPFHVQLRFTSPARLPDGELLLAGSGADLGLELVRTEGDGTALVRDVQTGPDGSSPQRLTRVGDRIYFSAERSDVGRELWISDGTAAGTQLVEDLDPAGSTFFEPSGAVHTTTGSTTSDGPTRAVVFMLVPKGSPLTSPA